VKINHDDLCPCTRFRAPPEFCQCGAIDRAEIVADVSKDFADRLREIMATPTPAPIPKGGDE
jgi:predicted ATPase with chaperone activity